VTLVTDVGLSISPDPTVRRRTTTVLVGVLVVLVVANIARSTIVPGGFHFAYNLAIAATIVLLGQTAGLTRDELGAGASRLHSGLRWGLLAAVVITGAVVLASLIPALSDAFEDSRTDVTARELALRALVVIPLGTVLVEEVIFRGVLHGLLARLYSTRVAIGYGAVLFGLWHVFPAARSGSDNALVDGTGRTLAVLGTLAATSLAGVGFCWLRTRSGSVLAPSLAHVATNSVPLVVAWFVAR
jgi:uncharacterized protein